MSRSRRRRKARTPSGTRSRLRLVLQVALLLFVAGVVAAGAGLAWLWPRCSGEGCPSVTSLRDYTPPQATRVFDRREQVIAHLAPERRIVVELSAVPKHVSGAFLSVEDKRFFQHDGIDYRRVMGSVARNARHMGFREGFSTITMQLARNVFPEHLTRAKTLRRKLWEVMIARKIEQAFTKEEILELYLNQIYLGDGLYGIEAAAQGYFGKPVKDLTLAEAATLSGIPKAPNHYNPRRNPEASLTRRNLALGLMAKAGLISEQEAEEAKQEPLTLVPPIEAQGDAPYFVAAIRKEIRERFGPEAETAGLRVFTTLDPALQKSAQVALRKQIEAVEAGKHGKFSHASCTGGAKDPEACLQGLFVAMDPQNGDVLALVGGRDFGISQFDRVTLARRQAGSAFKPFVYAAGIEAGIPVTTTLVGPGAEEYEGGYRPADHVADSLAVDMRLGMKKSSNRAVVALGERVGLSRVVQTAKAMGLTTPIQEYPSTVLGAADVVPMELVAAYTPFANNGLLTKPRLIRRVEDSSGKVLWEAPVEKKRVISAEAAYLTLDLMKDVVNGGTGYRVRQAGLPYSIPAAGKTGTSNDAADVWFVGATPDLVAGVWVGFDQRKRITHGAGGGNIAAPVWGEVMAGYYRTHPAPVPWIPPIDLVSARVDRETGLLATEGCPEERVKDEYFMPGTAPTEYCPLHPEPGIEGWLNRTVRGIGDWLGVGGRGEQPPAPAPHPGNVGGH